MATVLQGSAIMARTAAGVTAQSLRTVALFSTDAISLSLAIVLSYLLSTANTAPSASLWSPRIFVGVPLSLAAFAFQGLYPAVGINAVQHMKRASRSVTLVYLVLTASMSVTKDIWAVSRLSLFVCWLLSLLLVPFCRWIVVICVGSREWWQVPILVLGGGKTARRVIRNFAANRVLGYRPVACFDDDPNSWREFDGIPLAGSLGDVESFARYYRVNHAIVAMPGLPREQLLEHLRRWSTIFRHILIVPDLLGVASLWVQPRDLGGVLSIEIGQEFLSPFNRALKRAIDIVVSGLGLILSSPILFVSAIWIKCVSSGSAFYSQEREGQNGKIMRVVKLRTMVPNAESALQAHLEANPAAKADWERFCKLKDDPRILPIIGKFLRSTSLDELPQLMNVFLGEMSLVGPRPFPKYHNSKFDAEIRALRTRVPPGLTGLWQISARSDGDLDVQASLDSYYVHNWSLWLDLYIIIRTFRAVVFPRGAY
jgi:Undecaprenyl-phosphate galactose phosphotransferase WbaP